MRNQPLIEKDILESPLVHVLDVEIFRDSTLEIREDQRSMGYLANKDANREANASCQIRIVRAFNAMRQSAALERKLALFSHIFITIFDV